MPNATPNADPTAAQTLPDPCPRPAAAVLDAAEYEALGTAIDASFQIEQLAELLSPVLHLNEMYRLNVYARKQGRAATFDELDSEAGRDAVVQAAESLTYHVHKLRKSLDGVGY